MEQTMGRENTVRGRVDEAYFKEPVQTLFEKAEKHLYQKVLSYHIGLMDPCIGYLLQNVLKLVESKRFEEKKEVQDLEEKSKKEWKQNPLSWTWICSESEPETLLRAPREDLKICYHPVE